MVERAGGNRTAGKHEESVMIRNIIFDLGNVLIRFSPEDYLCKRNFTGPLKETILKDIFASEEWLLLDKDELSLAEAAERISEKSSLDPELITSVFSQRNETLEPMPDNTNLLPVLREKGYNLYYLSNFPFDMWEYLISLRENEYNFFRFFDGGIISAEVRCAKPDPAIYRHLLSRYGLEAGECLFIDDLPANGTAAVKIGMKALVSHGAPDIKNVLFNFLEKNS